MFHTTQITKRAVVDAIKRLEQIVPPAEHCDAPLNSPEVYDRLSSSDRALVDEAFALAHPYVRTSHDEPNRRALTELKKEGIQADLGASQYDPCKLDGVLRLGDISLDIGDE